jgi:hypothetical protein
MRQGWYWIFFKPCRMTWSRWLKGLPVKGGAAVLALTGLSHSAKITKDRGQQRDLTAPGQRHQYQRKNLG